ncbi:hypothetical protein AB8A20_20870 [Tardiphaga sp. 604_B6_N1_1]|uniref:hypothetical protein n=1 Tax=Tardiphaga sp. 604_B6_N1_1 TaxID=3240779 RepID=UPI003F222F21
MKINLENGLFRFHVTQQELKAAAIPPKEIRTRKFSCQSITRLIKNAGLESEIAVDQLPGEPQTITDLSELRSKVARARTSIAIDNLTKRRRVTSRQNAAAFLKCTPKMLKHFIRAGVLSKVPGSENDLFVEEVVAIRGMHFEKLDDLDDHPPGWKGAVVLRSS